MIDQARFFVVLAAAPETTTTSQLKNKFHQNILILILNSCSINYITCNDYDNGFDCFNE